MTIKTLNISDTYEKSNSLSKTSGPVMSGGIPKSGWESKWTIAVFSNGMCFDPIAR